MYEICILSLEILKSLVGLNKSFLTTILFVLG